MMAAPNLTRGSLAVFSCALALVTVRTVGEHAGLVLVDDSARSLGYDTLGNDMILADLPGEEAAATAALLLGQLTDVSNTCKRSLRSYALCQAKSGLYSVCASKELLNSTGMQTILGCAGVKDPDARLQECQKKCFEEAGLLMNDTFAAPCSAAMQAMHGFNEGFDLFTIGTVDTGMNLSQAILLPFPNVKSPVGPSTMQLGYPEKCVEVPTAQYCILSGQLPLAGGGALSSKMAFTFSVGNCLPSACPEEELRSALSGLQGATAQRLLLNIQCGFVRPIGEATGTSQATERFLGWGGVPVEHISTIDMTTGFVVTLCLCGLIALLVALGTVLDLRRDAMHRKLQEQRESTTNGAGAGATNEHQEMAQPLAQAPAEEVPMGCLEGFLNHWSLIRNCGSLMRLRPPEQNIFACMDAIRVFSMFQVILGHSFLYPMLSSGLSNMEQFGPPNGLLSTAWFMVIPGCFYGVDSFFLLSGFLCAHGLQKKVFSKPQFKTPAGFSVMYIKFVVMRYLRLLPLEMFSILLVCNVLPNIGTGVVWDMDRPDGRHCYEAAGAGQCSETWWANALFIQNMDKFLGKCMGHTWYLAADMQIYITAPFFSLVYGLNRKAGWCFLGLGLAAGIALPMALMAHYQWVPDMLLGGTRGFSQKVYMKPWCRLSPFFIGIALAWLWGECFEKHRGRSTRGWTRVQSYALGLLGVGMCCAATFGRLALYQCDLKDCMSIDTNPTGKFFMYLWTGFSIPVWATGLGIIMILCFQDRFLPLLQPFLHQSFWQPLAKLTYAAYLIHTCVLILDFCQRDSQLSYTASGYFFSVVAFAVISMMAAFCLYVLVEKPLANLQMKLLGGGGD